MRKILFILLFSSTAYSQSYTEKYNDFYNRYEYFNNAGEMIGYKYYDNLYKVWKYKDLSESQNSNYVSPLNTELMVKALNSKDARYNQNVERIQGVISEIRKKVDNLDYSPKLRTAIWNLFNAECLNVIDKRNYDYSNSNTAQQVINFMYSKINAILEDTDKKVNSDD